ncbi:PilN domain-containing protein [Chromobacterium haemolyticum]|uniref:PilN domain-containing protein n=1 Tax=Chromobacterium haemolyticum TaxID=394935 RepID=UPI0009D93F40|nr:PilN domain-containing protein [Chromobacterium haemolyticum]OQS35515.1 fimbrial protein [Chromobacterium haemolyticum]
MIRINLLPHREQKKAAHRLRFQVMLGLTLVASLTLVVLSYLIIGGRLSHQQQRNDFLQGEISKLDSQIKNIGTLKKQRDDLLSRKQLVERLEQGRNEGVHVFDQLVRQTPDGVYLKNFKQAGNQFTLSGYALSGARVSNYMRSLAQSNVFDVPVLVEVKAASVNGQRANEFTLNCSLREAAPPKTGQPTAPGAKP